MRIALGIEYDGSDYCGWQKQKHANNTIQAHLENALSKVANHSIELICAGRTDAGVHALEQVAHFDTQAQRQAHNWILGGNVQLPPSIKIIWAKAVDPSFHARFSAQRRTYRYWIINRPARPAIWHRRATWVYAPLDADRMAEAGQALIGEHDFSSYRTVHCQAHSPVRTLYDLQVKRQGEFILIQVTANGFLHHMVRNIAGVLIAIGEAKRPISWAAEVLEQKDRTQGGITAPADGLYFYHVQYDARFQLPQKNHSSFFP